MTRRPILLALVLLAVAAAPAPACDGAVIRQADGELMHDIWFTVSHTPAFCLWYSPDGATSFHATEVDGGGNIDCPNPWVAHCDADSLSFSGSWPVLDLPLVVMWVDYGVRLTCTVAFAEATRLTAVRQVTGTLYTDVHSATLTWPDGTVQPLLAGPTEPDRAEVVVPAGVYGLEVHVDAKARNEAPYAGRVHVTWEDAGPVATEPASWGGLKGLYR